MTMRVRRTVTFPSFFGDLSQEKIHDCLWKEVKVVLKDEQFLKMNKDFHESFALIDACARAAQQVKLYADDNSIGPLARNLVIQYLLDHFICVWTEILNSEH